MVLGRSSQVAPQAWPQGLAHTGVPRSLTGNRLGFAFRDAVRFLGASPIPDQTPLIGSSRLERGTRLLGLGRRLAGSRLERREVRREAFVVGRKPGVLGAPVEDGIGRSERDAGVVHHGRTVARDGHRMVAWQYVLNGASEPPTTAAWNDWQKFDGIMLSLDKPMSGKPVTIRFENVAVASARDDSLFRPPSSP